MLKIFGVLIIFVSLLTFTRWHRYEADLVVPGFHSGILGFITMCISDAYAGPTCHLTMPHTFI